MIMSPKPVNWKLQLMVNMHCLTQGSTQNGCYKMCDKRQDNEVNTTFAVYQVSVQLAETAHCIWRTLTNKHKNRIESNLPFCFVFTKVTIECFLTPRTLYWITYGSKCWHRLVQTRIPQVTYKCPMPSHAADTKNKNWYNLQHTTTI